MRQRRGAMAATARRLERERRERDEQCQARDLTDNEVWAAVYRLQGRRDPRVAPRIRELLAEQKRRRGA